MCQVLLYCHIILILICYRFGYPAISMFGFFEDLKVVNVCCCIFKLYYSSCVGYAVFFLQCFSSLLYPPPFPHPQPISFFSILLFHLLYSFTWVFPLIAPPVPLLLVSSVNISVLCFSSVLFDPLFCAIQFHSVWLVLLCSWDKKIKHHCEISSLTVGVHLVVKRLTCTRYSRASWQTHFGRYWHLEVFILSNTVYV